MGSERDEETTGAGKLGEAPKPGAPVELVAAVTSGTVTSYQSLRRLQEHDYSKRLVQNPPTDRFGEPVRPIPLLLHDTETDRMYVTARHMAVFLRYELGIGDVGSDDQIVT